MADQATIRRITERNVGVLALKPTRGHLTAATRARWMDGLRCQIEEGPWQLAADMPLKASGEESAPTPGMLGRGALASCLVIGVATWAARLGVPVEGLEVEVEADFDARGELGMGGVSPGYSEVRYAVQIESPAPEAEVDQVLALAERHTAPTSTCSAVPSRSGAVQAAEQCINGISNGKEA
jgi:uncharacterized OsmC-like protein